MIQGVTLIKLNFCFKCVKKNVFSFLFKRKPLSKLLNFNMVYFSSLLQFDEGKNKFEGAISTDAVEKFVVSNKLPLVIDFNQDVSCILIFKNLKRYLKV